MEIHKEVVKCWKATEKNWKKYKRDNKNLCGHRYPYFVRWFDDLSESGKMIERICYCHVCKKKFKIRYRLDTLHEPTFGFDKGRETIIDLQKELKKNVKEYIENVKKNHPKEFANVEEAKLTLSTGREE